MKLNHKVVLLNRELIGTEEDSDINIRGKDGKLTANDKNSANYWSRRVLWNA